MRCLKSTVSEMEAPGERRGRGRSGTRNEGFIKRCILWEGGEGPWEGGQPMRGMEKKSWLEAANEKQGEG